MTVDQMHASLLLHGWEPLGNTYVKDDGGRTPIYASYIQKRVYRSEYSLDEYRRFGTRELSGHSMREIYRVVMEYEQEQAREQRAVTG